MSSLRAGVRFAHDFQWFAHSEHSTNTYLKTCIQMQEWTEALTAPPKKKGKNAGQNIKSVFVTVLTV